MGTDGAYTLLIEQLNTTGVVSVLDITQASNAADAVNLTANSIDTEIALDISTAALTSGSAIKITGNTATSRITNGLIEATSDVGGGGSLIELNPDFSGSAATGYGIYQSATDTTTAANTDYGLYSTLAASGNLATNTAGTYYGIYGNVAKTGTDTSNTTNTTTLVIGTTGIGSNTASTDDAQNLRNTYGGYFSATGNTNSTSTAYGIYATSTGADTIASGRFSATDTNTSGTSTYGIYNTWASSAVVTATAQTAYGIYNTVTKTGLDTSTAASTFYGTYSAVSDSGATNVASTRTGYGAYFSTSVADAGSNSTSSSYGVYSLAKDADTNYSVFAVSQGSADITGSFADNNLQTGKLLNATSTSTNLTTAKLANVDHTATYVSSQTNSGNLLNLNRALTTNQDTISFLDSGISFINETMYFSNTTGSSSTSRAYAPAGTNRIAILGIGYQTAAGTTQVSSVTWGSTSFSLIGASCKQSNGTGISVEVWYAVLGDSAYDSLLYPFTFTFSNGNSTDNWRAQFSVYTGAAQSAPTGCVNNTGASLTPSVTITNTAGNFATDVAGVEISGNMTAGGSQTKRWGISAIMALASSDQATGGTPTNSWTLSNAGTPAWVDIGFSIPRAAAPTLTLSGATASFTSSCTATAGTCTDSSNVLSLTQSYASASGAVLNISNSGTGASINLATTGSRIDLATGSTGNTFIIRIPTTSTTSSTACATNTSQGLIWQNAAGTRIAHSCADTTAQMESWGGAWNTGATDLAENYSDPTNGLEPGDVVSINKNGPIKAIRKSSAPYDTDLIGIISTQPGYLMTDINEGTGETDLINPKPVALVGRVPTKVSTENGPIEVGDHLTSSSIPGVAMRADPRLGATIGKALEAFNGPGSGTILVFVENNTRPNLQTAFADIDFEAQSFATSSNNTTIDTFGNITTAGNAYVTGQLSVVSGLNVNCQMSSVNCLSVANGAFTVDDLGNVATTGNITTAGQLQGQFLKITGDAQIGGDLTVNGQLSIVNGQLSVASIQSLESSNLEIRLGDSAGVNSLKILDSVNRELLTVNSAGQLSLAADGAYLSIPRGYICIDDDGACDVTGPVNGTIYADAFVTNGTADLAESFPTTDDSIEAGNIVAVDPQNKEHILPSDHPYQPTILGIISTEPGITLNAFETKTTKDGPCIDDKDRPCEEKSSQKLALAGRVPTKVNLENGPIKAGDPITSSSTPGVGMRADRPGRIVGIALESFGGENSQRPNSPTAQQPAESEAIGTIVVFVEPGWYIGTALADNGSLHSSGQANNQQPATNNQLTSLTNPDGTLSDYELQTTNYKLTADQIRQLITDEVARQLDIIPTTGYRLPTTDSIDSPIATDSALLAEATNSARLADETQNTLDELNELLATTNLQLDTLTVTGNSQLAQTQVAGTFSQDGTLVIDYGRQINVLGSTLYLQNDGLAGSPDCHSGLSRIDSEVAGAPQNDTCGILVDIGAGTVTIDREGNLKITGTLTANNVKTKELTIDTSDENAKTIGEAKIASGQSQVTIFTTAIKPDAKIFITPTSSVQGRSLYVAAKSEFEGFTVRIDSGSAQGAITFDWFIVNSDKQVSAGSDAPAAN
ncbi:MAG: Hemagluttinin family protein [Candidatus Gottesmanbacteria bacterium GW2011_GWA1_48_13]|uniref:Hemagluttinin family protein n=1 Tax=Candidatus Gottesmanbacteria bacterium GW2011_GWA1_48_13 TaxID=1618439 RepID=A0A0G1UMK5_9BACT|nr:MAG: Hemagluttinin family protein [Candidatus Gottesmanbacteria bacterium GW2011_GWA1_48_13]